MADSAKMNYLGDLFTRDANEHGMRGDTHLWELLRKRLADVPMPANYFDVRELVRQAIIAEVDIDIDAFPRDNPDGIFVEKLSKRSGLTNGRVLPMWWKRTGVPILVDRWAAQHASN